MSRRTRGGLAQIAPHALHEKLYGHGSTRRQTGAVLDGKRRRCAPQRGQLRLLKPDECVDFAIAREAHCTAVGGSNRHPEASLSMWNEVLPRLGAIDDRMFPVRQQARARRRCATGLGCCGGGVTQRLGDDVGMDYAPRSDRRERSLWLSTPRPAASTCHRHDEGRFDVVCRAPRADGTPVRKVNFSGKHLIDAAVEGASVAAARGTDLVDGRSGMGGRARSAR